MTHRMMRLAWAWVTIALAAPISPAAGAESPPRPPKGAVEYQAPPRPSDGACMALTVEKLEKGLSPERPLVIWAIGSSFTNGLGDGELLAQLIRERFPSAPKIVYKKIAGNSTSYHFSHGWARHLVVPDQPDVVLIYNFGQTEDLEKMIVELRSHTTADIVVGSLHWCLPHKPIWPDPQARNGHQDPPALRSVCEKYGVEFVENRREMTQYMLDNHLAIEDLLADAVHENRYAARMTVMNIARHFHRAAESRYDPRARERRVEAESSPAVEKDARWAAAEGGSALAAASPGSTVSVRFTGNRVDLIGLRGPGGGSADVWLDGRPASQAEAFYAGYVDPAPRNVPCPPNPPRDRCPHAVTLRANVVPQTWTIAMTSDRGDYALVGSVTGPDGTGSAFKSFAGNSGQVLVEPEFWRDPQNNRRGDRFTFEVVRATAASVDFRAPAKERFRLRLAANLVNGPHLLKLVARGDGVVTVDGFDIFEPQLAESATGPASQPGARSRLVGTWRLVSIEERDAGGQVVTPMDYGPNPVGILIYDATGHMSVHAMRRGRPRLDSDDVHRATPEQAKAAFVGYNGYFGTYEVDEQAGVVIHYVEGGLIPNWEGGQQRRRFTLSGDTLILQPPPIQAAGQARTRRLTWQRIAAQ
jgi:hypothetical protein